MESEYDLAFEEKENLEKAANQTRKLIGLIQESKNSHISRIKGLFLGFKLFCSEACLDYENVINIASIKNCCHDLDLLLESEVKTDMQYADQVKVFFLGYWNY